MPTMVGCPTCGKSMPPGGPCPACTGITPPATYGRRDRYCPQCGAVGTPKTQTKGSILIEIILWLCFIVPGVIYSLWRMTSGRTQVCRTCGAPNLLPLDSPKARAALAS